MRKPRLPFYVLIPVFLFFFLVQQAFAAECRACDELGLTSHFTLSGKTRVVKGAIDFCQRNPEICGDTAKEIQIEANDRLLEMLADVNLKVNNTIADVVDQIQFKQSEYWTHVSLRGDCEDHALMKRQILIGKGIPAGSLQLVVLYSKKLEERHAILAVNTDRGLYLLDSLSDRLETPLSIPHYRYEFIQVPGMFDHFNEINGLRM